MKKLYIILYFSLVCASIMQAQSNTQGNLKKTEKKGKYGYVDGKGNWVVPAEYVQIGEFDEYRHPVRAQKEKQGWGYVNYNGKEITKFIYYHAFPFYNEELALVCESYIDGRGKPYYRYGYINANGVTAIDVSYKKAFPFSEGLAAVKKSKGTKYGFIDKRGTEIIGFKFDDVKWGFKEGLVWVNNGSNWGMINKNGVTKVDFQYSSISNYDPETGFADAKTSQGTTHYYNAKGEKFNTAKERIDANKSKTRPTINWDDIPSSTKDQLFALIATVKSDSKIEYCKIYLNGNQTASYSDKTSPLSITQFLNLREGENKIKIEAKNEAGSETKEQTINYDAKSAPVNKPIIAFIDLPQVVYSPQLEVKAEITSESEITSWHIYLKGNTQSGGLTPGGSYRAQQIVESNKKTISQELELREGKNTIVVEATNKEGGKEKKEAVVIYVYEKPAPPTIQWTSEIPDKTIEPQLTVKAEITSKSDVTWRICTNSTGKTKGSSRSYEITEIASGKGRLVEGKVALKEGYNTIRIEASNASGKKDIATTVWYSPCEKRIALVIGNKQYHDHDFGECTLSINDANTIAKMLEEECGFVKVIKVLDADYRKMEEAINEFINKIKDNNYETAFIYYSGHGISFSKDDGDNYLIPVDCTCCTEEIKKYGFDIKTKILDRLGRDKEVPNCSVKIAMLDCCRSNNLIECHPNPNSPGKTKGIVKTKGLSKMEIPEGIAVFYGAEFGHGSYVGDGYNSPFVECFVQYFREHPNTNWRDLGFEVSEKVRKKTINWINEYNEVEPQIPQHDVSKFYGAGNFYLNPYHDMPNN